MSKATEKAAAKRQAYRMVADLIQNSLAAGWIVTLYEEEALEEIRRQFLRRTQVGRREPE
jgi:hypothetical protein